MTHASIDFLIKLAKFRNDIEAILIVTSVEDIDLTLIAASEEICAGAPIDSVTAAHTVQNIVAGITRLRNDDDL